MNQWHCIVNIPETWVFGEKKNDQIINRQAQITCLSENKWAVVVGHFGTNVKSKELAFEKAEKYLKIRNS